MPITSVRLFAKRLVAFAADIVVLVLLIVGATSFLYRIRFASPSGITSMAIVWSWVVFFVVVEWRFEGSLGTVAAGLRLRAREVAGPSLLSCLARNLLTLVVPFALAGRILSIVALTSLKAKMEWSLALTILFLLPLSIIFTGGQSLVDILLGLSVLPKGSRKDQFPINLTRKKLLLTVLTASLAGTIIAFMPTLIEVGRRSIQGSDPLITEYYLAADEDKKAAAGIWAHLQTGAPNADGFLTDVHVYSVYGKLPSPEESDARIAASSCDASYRSRHAYRLIRLQLDYLTPTLITSDVFAALLKGSIRYSGRPAFLVVESSVPEPSGFFRIEWPQQYLLCLGGSDDAPQNDILDVRPSFFVESSINEIAWLLTADLEQYSYVEHVPIFP